MELANVTVDEIKRAADNMKEVEIARARTQMKAGLLMGLESPSARAERLARMLAVGLIMARAMVQSLISQQAAPTACRDRDAVRRPDYW